MVNSKYWKHRQQQEDCVNLKNIPPLTLISDIIIYDITHISSIFIYFFQTKAMENSIYVLIKERLIENNIGTKIRLKHGTPKVTCYITQTIG